MRVIVAVGVVVPVIVPVGPAMTIGAAFRVERGLKARYLAAKLFQHVGYDMIEAQHQPVDVNFTGQMPVADMPGGAHQVQRICGDNLHDVFGRGTHADMATIFKQQVITFMQLRGFGQVEQEGEAPVPRHHHAPPMTVVIGKGDRIDRFVMAVCYVSRADHVFLFE